jgi:phosphatidylglycerol:prolipoprotein diacylglycerol transferase
MLTYPNIDPVIFRIGFVELRWYSLVYMLGLMALSWYCNRGSKKNELDLTIKEVDNLMLYILIGLIIGARLFYVMFYDLYAYMQNPINIFKIWQGGLSFHGAVIGIWISVYSFSIIHKKSHLEIIDYCIIIAPIFLGLGRIANFINGELWGRATDVPWAMVFPRADSLPRHPSQLYEAFFEGLILFFVLLFIKSKKPRKGVMSGSFLIFYGIFRFFIEFFREPDDQFKSPDSLLGTVLGPFSMGQIMCMFMIMIGFIVISTNSPKKI